MLGFVSFDYRGYRAVSRLVLSLSKYTGHRLNPTYTRQRSLSHGVARGLPLNFSVKKDSQKFTGDGAFKGRK
ncbi:hypothetical protein VB715_01925 [Crocosphaera sp. UHCC 0190]|uniref:hypothetical protein n=1 Tax=Crocosphaera sp. UHCC 0190 TaxID=3110246 RepID=UPI002B1FB74F|nr:hypothetical protein [Crocosphaera sp. UHCC 0190]MEA5508513.1 hypothetical protein [Crocosphaera sp. UHCC 0190]